MEYIDINTMAQKYVLRTKKKFEWGALAAALFPDANETNARMRLMNMRRGYVYRYSIEQLCTLSQFFECDFAELISNTKKIVK